MDLTQVTKLIEAGFTAQEIREMMQGTQQDPQPEPQPEPETKPEPQPEPETNPEPQPDQTEQRLTNIENNISSLLKAIQESNVRNDTQLGGNTKSMQELTNDAMNALINPTKEEHK
jgi:DNA-binding transcriptional MerR regulator